MSRFQSRFIFSSPELHRISVKDSSGSFIDIKTPANAGGNIGIMNHGHADSSIIDWCCQFSFSADGIEKLTTWAVVISPPPPRAVAASSEADSFTLNTFPLRLSTNYLPIQK